MKNISKNTLKSPKVRTENWPKKAVITARDSSGRFIAWRKKTKKFLLRDANKVFKENRSFSKTKKTTVLRNVVEVQDYSDKPQRPSEDIAMKIQYFVEGRLKTGELITARSLQHDIDYSKDKMRDEAFENFFYRLADSQGFDYSKEIGEEYYAEFKDKIQIREGFVYYKARPGIEQKAEA